MKRFRPYALIIPAIRELCPEYITDFEEEFHTNKMSWGNIIVCRKDLFDKYCEWIFPIMFRAEEIAQEKGISLWDREMGFISEYLLNIWIRHQKLSVVYKPIYFVGESGFKWKLFGMLERLRLDFLIDDYYNFMNKYSKKGKKRQDVISKKHFLR